jgi:hypothetical protein
MDQDTLKRYESLGDERFAELQSMRKLSDYTRLSWAETEVSMHLPASINGMTLYDWPSLDPRRSQCHPAGAQGD